MVIDGGDILGPQYIIHHFKKCHPLYMVWRSIDPGITMCWIICHNTNLVNHVSVYTHSVQ